MPADEENTRKVQTAVAGGPGADRPVYLSMDAVEFGGFIGLHPARDFYCGTLLGGCGEKLAARKYLDKKCHFPLGRRGPLALAAGREPLLRVSGNLAQETLKPPGSALSGVPHTEFLASP
jgi:hypothetical protein